MKLRPYQEEAVRHTLSAWKTSRSVLLHLATGTGKTIIFSELCRQLAGQGKRVCVVMHLQTLVEQTVSKLKAFWNQPIGIVCAACEKNRNVGELVTVASIQSLSRFLKRNGCMFDYMIIDESHHIPPKNIVSQYGATLSELFTRNPDMKLLGVTATPFRMKQGSIAGSEHSWFSDITYHYGVKEAQKDGYLCKYQHLVPCDIRKDLQSIPLSNGEYQKIPLSECLRKQKHLQSVWTSLEKFASDRRHIGVYAVDITHAEAITELLNEHGLPSGCVHSKKKENNGDVFRDFSEGRLKALVSVDMLTEGYDFPAMDCLVIVAPTKSLARHLQIIGRGLRIAENKHDCLILDLACNALYHGSARTPIFHDEEPNCITVACPKCSTLNGVVPGRSMTYHCTHCGTLLTKEAGIRQSRRLPNGRVEIMDEGTSLFLPYMENDRLRDVLRTHKTFPCVSASYNVKKGLFGDYIAVSMYFIHDNHLFCSVLNLSPEGPYSEYFKYVWSFWGDGCPPSDAFVFMSAIREKRFTIPERMELRLDKNGKVKPVWREETDHHPYVDQCLLSRPGALLRRATA